MSEDSQFLLKQVLDQSRMADYPTVEAGYVF